MGQRGKCRRSSVQMSAITLLHSTFLAQKYVRNGMDGLSRGASLEQANRLVELLRETSNVEQVNNHRPQHNIDHDDSVCSLYHRIYNAGLSFVCSVDVLASQRKVLNRIYAQKAARFNLSSLL